MGSGYHLPDPTPARALRKPGLKTSGSISQGFAVAKPWEIVPNARRPAFLASVPPWQQDQGRESRRTR
jgi:hypothetical protein